jgi:hypothetical protein
MEGLLSARTVMGHMNQIKSCSVGAPKLIEDTCQVCSAGCLGRGGEAEGDLTALLPGAGSQQVSWRQ